MMKDLIKIFVCTFDKEIKTSSDVFIPMQVGKAVSNFDFGYVNDDTGDNISEKNQYYSEQSGVYWVWKNLKDSHPEYVGFCHYRKLPYFAKDHVVAEFYTTLHKYRKSGSLELDNIRPYLIGADCVCIKPLEFNDTVEKIYKSCHIAEDFDVLHNLIKEKYSQYLEAFEYILCRRKMMFPYNIYIMRWDLFDEYCNFIFSVFADLEKLIVLKSHTGYQSRVFGYIAERLLTVFLEYKRARVRCVPCALINEYF